jgi:hypothetical protein
LRGYPGGKSAQIRNPIYPRRASRFDSLTSGSLGPSAYVVGRLKTVSPMGGLRGHRVVARASGRLVDSTTTDRAGRFLLQWFGAESERISVELLNSSGAVAESVELTPGELVSSAVILFSGDKVVSENAKAAKDDTGIAFEADGDSPVCVTSSCIGVELSWCVASGMKVSIESEGKSLGHDLESSGSLTVVEKDSRTYTLVVETGEAGPPKVIARAIEIRRYPSLSVVVEDTKFRKGEGVELGVSTSCPAGETGLVVSIRSSDPEILAGTNFLMPKGSTWMRLRLETGWKTGMVEVIASAPGYVQDGISLSSE